MNKERSISRGGRAMFMGRFLRSPRAVGSITPSSQALARAVAVAVPWDAVQTIVELGAGTGTLTAWLQRLRDPDSRMLCFEKDERMRERLAQLYPEAEFHRDALNLLEVLQTESVGAVDCVVCSLPLRNFPRTEIESLLRSCHSALRPGGVLVLYQYSPRLRELLVRIFGDVSDKVVLWNIPPASVYTCRKDP